ncbi:unnamed protein product [Scytosiphon promiscuus]
MLQGKRALVVGVANARSIAWGIANRWRQEGAEVFVTYQASGGSWLCNERFRKPVEKLVRDSWGPYDTAGAPVPAAACDVTDVSRHPSSAARVGRRFRASVGLWTICSTTDARFVPDSRFVLPSPRRRGVADRAAEISAPRAIDCSGHSFVRRLIERSLSRRRTSPNSGERFRRGAGSRSGGGGMLLESEGAVFGRGRTGNEEPGKKAVDVILHSVAHAPTDAMRQGFLMGTTREAFVSAHVVSAYSLVSTVRHALPFLSPGASVMALTYIGSQRAAANYNVMGPAKASLESCARALALELGGPRREHGGAPDSPVPGDDGCGSLGPGGVRVNCLSAGPVRTMAARGITGFDEMRREAAGRAPLGEGLAGVDEIAGVATFLASPLLSAAVTGQTLYADRGFSSVV